MAGAAIDETLVLGLTITSGEPITGTVTGAVTGTGGGGGDGLPFCGWLELMAIVNDARSRLSTTSDGLVTP